MSYIFLFILFLIILFWFFILIKFSKKRVLIRKEKKEFFLKHFKEIWNDVDIKHRIINYDKLYNLVLIEIWYKWTFGDILKLEPKEITDINKIWELHKLRNKLVHDFDIIDNMTLNKKTKEYKQELINLFDKVF